MTAPTRPRTVRRRASVAILASLATVASGCAGAGPAHDELRPDGRTRYHVRDRLGSAALILDADGSVVARSAHTPYGQRWIDWRAPDQHGPAHRFTGHEDDPISGAVYAGARHYLPALGRWASPDLRFLLDDPGSNLAIPDQANPYQYAANDPVNRTDPDGEAAPVLVAIGIGAGLGAAYGMGGELVSQVIRGDFDAGKLATAGVAGAATGAATVVNPILGSAVGAATSGAKTYVDRTVIDGQDVSASEVGVSMVVGAIPTPGKAAAVGRATGATATEILENAAGELGGDAAVTLAKQFVGEASALAHATGSTPAASYSEPEPTDPAKLCSGC